MVEQPNLAPGGDESEQPIGYGPPTYENPAPPSDAQYPETYDPEAGVWVRDMGTPEAAQRALVENQARGIVYQDQNTKQTKIITPEQNESLEDVAEKIRQNFGEPQSYHGKSNEWGARELTKVAVEEPTNAPESKSTAQPFSKFKPINAPKIEKGATGHTTSQIARTPAELAQMEADSRRAFDMAKYSVPVLGTSILIANGASKRDIAVSAALDATMFIPIGKVVGFAKGAISGSREAAVVKASISADRASTRETLKLISGKNAVKAFDEYSKAGEAYADNLIEIKAVEKAIKLNPADTATEKLIVEQQSVRLDALRTKTLELKQKALQKAYNLGEKVGKNAGGDLPLTETVRESSGHQVRGIENVVDKAFSDAPTNINAAAKRLNRFKAEIKNVEPNSKRYAELQRQIPELKNNLRLVYASEARRLNEAAIQSTRKLEALKLERMAHPENKVAIDAQITQEAKRLATLKTESTQALKWMEIEWAEEIQRGGRGGVAVKAPPSATGSSRAVLRHEVRDIRDYGISAGQALKIISSTIPAKSKGDKATFKPGEVYNPSKTPEKERVPGGGPSPENKPGGKAGAATETGTGNPPAPTRTPFTPNSPGDSPSPIPHPTPAPSPAPAPQPQPEPDKTKVPPKEKIPPKDVITPRLPVKLPAPGRSSTDEERREFLSQVQGLVTTRRGELGGKDVWLVAYYPYGPLDKTTVLGNAPEGATHATGKGSMYESAQLLKGIPPKEPVFFDTGAVDTTLEKASTGERRMVARSIPDKSVNKRETERPTRKYHRFTRSEILQGIRDKQNGLEYRRNGRAHIPINP